MNVLTSFAVVSTGEGKRVSYTYSVIDADGNVQQSNVRRSFIATTGELLGQIAAIESVVSARLETTA
ncbi:MAG: hypothetical protein ACI4OL_06710 [Gemmiger sp.]